MTNSRRTYRLRVMHKYAEEFLTDGEPFKVETMFNYMNSYITPYGTRSKMSCVTYQQLRWLLKLDPCFERISIEQWKYKVINNVMD